MPAALVVVLIVALLLWMFMSYVGPPWGAKQLVATVVIVLLVLWLLGYSVPLWRELHR